MPQLVTNICEENVFSSQDIYVQRRDICDKTHFRHKMYSFSDESLCFIDKTYNLSQKMR